MLSTAPPAHHHSTSHVVRVPPTRMQPPTAHHPEPKLPPQPPSSNVCFARPRSPCQTPRHTHAHTLHTHPIPPYHKDHTAARHFRAHANTTHHHNEAASNSSALPAMHLSHHQAHFPSIRWCVSGPFLGHPTCTAAEVFSFSGPFLCHPAQTRTCVYSLSGPSLGNPARMMDDFRHISGSVRTIQIFGVPSVSRWRVLGCVLQCLQSRFPASVQKSF